MAAPWRKSFLFYAKSIFTGKETCCIGHSSAAPWRARSLYLQAKKRVVLVIAWQHPGESPSSFMRSLYLQAKKRVVLVIARQHPGESLFFARSLYLQAKKRVVLVIARQHPGESLSSFMRSLYLQAKKRVVLVIARQHPGESPSSFVVQGIFKKPLKYIFLYLNLIGFN